MYYKVCDWMVPTSTIVFGTEFKHFWEEEDDNFILNISIPGISKKDLSVKVKKDTSIIIEGEGKLGKINKQYLLPEDSNVKDLKVTLKNGILTIIIPKENNEREVEIK